MQRMLFARVLLQDARLIVLDEPFNAIDAKTSADLLALVKRWHAERRTVLAALHDMDLVRANFPETLLLARGPGRLGRHRRGADRGESPGGAADVRSLRRQRRRLRGRRCAVAGRLKSWIQCDDLRRADRALHRIRIHAPGAGGRDRAFARRRADRRVPDAAADEPGRRRHGACHPAGRGDRLSAVGAQSVRDDDGRADRRLYGRDSGRRRGAHHRTEGRCLAGHLLSGVARARRHHRLDQGHQYRSAARAVRQYPGDGRPDPAGRSRSTPPSRCSCWR